MARYRATARSLYANGRRSRHRVDQGLVDRKVEVDDDALEFVAARALNPQKSRILLQLALAAGISGPAAIQAEFDAPRHAAS